MSQKLRDGLAPTGAKDPGRVLAAVVLAGMAAPRHHDRADSDARALRDGMIVLTDKGLAGKEMEHLAAEQVGVLLARPDRKDEKCRFGNLAGMRQWIESVNDTLKGQLDLEQHGGRTEAGVYARIAHRLLALAAAIWHNWATDAPVKRSLIAYDH